MTDNAMDIGVQLAELLGDKDYNAALRWTVLASSYPITTIHIVDDSVNQLIIRFENGAQLILKDSGQSCCERRYMSSDDDLTTYAGGYLRGVEVVDGPSDEGEWGEVHEQRFLKVRTTQGDFTVVTHNEHNGYYGGISIDTSWLEP